MFGERTEEALWDVRDIAKFLRMSEGAVYAAVERGQIPCLRLGRRLRFRPAAVQAWVEGTGGPAPRKGRGQAPGRG